MKTEKHALYFVFPFYNPFAMLEKEDNIISFFEILLCLSNSHK